MTRADITNALDEEISRLQQVKRLLQGKGELTHTLAGLVKHKQTTGRVISAEGRRRIAEAQKRRWAKAKAL